MEYEFIHDSITGDAKARFSLDHEIIGPWIEVELGQDSSKITQLLQTIVQVEKSYQNDVVIIGHEYSVSISQSDVEIYANAGLNDEELLPEMLATEHIHYDDNVVATCGIEDFRELLLSWAEFINTL